MKHRIFWTRFFLIATLATAALIFFFSAQQGSDSAALSDGVTLQVAKLIKPGFNDLPASQKRSILKQLSAVVRKCAHFGEFALLSFNLLCWLRLRRWEKPARAAFLPAWGIATLYAGTDELHQMFVAERGPALLDVCIDSAGALTGALVALVGALLLARRLSAKA